MTVIKLIKLGKVVGTREMLRIKEDCVDVRECITEFRL